MEPRLEGLSGPSQSFGVNRIQWLKKSMAMKTFKNLNGKSQFHAPRFDAWHAEPQPGTLNTCKQ
jgi:hypothetical protein